MGFEIKMAQFDDFTDIVDRLERMYIISLCD